MTASPGRSARSIAQVMHDLGNERHFEVLGCVALGPKRVTAISEYLGLDMSTVSRSLHRLREYGLVVSERHKTSHVYAVEPDAVAVRLPGEIRIRIVAGDGGRLLLEIPIACHVRLDGAARRTKDERRTAHSEPRRDPGERSIGANVSGPASRHMTDTRR